MNLIISILIIKKGVNNQVWKVFLIKPQINEENVEKNAIERC